MSQNDIYSGETLRGLNLNETLVAFEKQHNLGPTRVAKLLKVAYPTYAAYKSGARPLPEYHLAQLMLIGLLGDEVRAQYIKEFAWPKKTP